MKSGQSIKWNTTQTVFPLFNVKEPKNSVPGDSLPGQSGTIKCVLVIKILISTALSDGGSGTHLIVSVFFTLHVT